MGEGAFAGSGIESVKLPRALRVIRERVFAQCSNLKEVIFGMDSAVEEISAWAFWGSGLESFTTPPALKKIGDLAFGNCPALRNFRLNEEVQELGWLCLWGTGVTELKLPPQVRMTPEQLGVGQDTKTLRLPDGLETVRSKFFERTDIEKLFISSSIRKLGPGAFYNCKQLREVVFESGS